MISNNSVDDEKKISNERFCFTEKNLIHANTKLAHWNRFFFFFVSSFYKLLFLFIFSTKMR